MERWQQKVAVVTGAYGGIGRAICDALVAAGLQVIGLDVHIPPESQLPKPGEIEWRRCDVANPEEVKKIFQNLKETDKRTNILVNCAGVLFQGHITDIGRNPLTLEQILTTIDVNLKGTIICTREAISWMKKFKVDGHIININSIAGHYIPFSDTMNVYASSKHGVSAFTASLNNELAASGSKIKVTSLSPGVVDTTASSQPRDVAGSLLFALSVPPFVNCLSPGLVATAMATSVASDVARLQPSDIADAVLYALATPPHINVSELTITSVTEKRL